MTKVYEVLVYEGWGKSYLIEADSKEEAEKKYETEPMAFDSAQINETFIVETNESD